MHIIKSFSKAHIKPFSSNNSFCAFCDPLCAFCVLREEGAFDEFLFEIDVALFAGDEIP